ncbi:MAG: ATP-binding protein [Candidatus Omnitrophota bacterium]
MTKDKFFGRREQLNILLKRIGDLKDGYRQNIAILGDELVGKTSLIYKLLGTLWDNRTIVLYLEVRPQALESFAKRYMSVLFYNFLSNSGITLREDLVFLISKSERFIPRTAAKARSILSSLEKRKTSDIFPVLLSLPDLIHQETGKFCVVILDEFHNLEKMGIKKLYAEWSKLLILHKSTMYVIISSMKFRAQQVLARNLSLLFGNFEVINIEPFDVKISEDYLNNHFRERGMAVNKGMINFIVHFTGGYPFYLETISRQLTNPGIEGLVDALEELLFSSAGMLNQRFSHYLKRFLDLPQSRDFIEVLYLISNGHNKLRDISHILHRQQKDLRFKVGQMVELDMISRNGDFLKINDRVFSFWLKFVYQEKAHAFTFDAKSQKELFREKIFSMVKEFVTAEQKPISERLIELLRLFDDDMVQLDRKKIRLSHFREIKPLELNGRFLKDGIIGRSSENVWIMGLKKEAITEEDIVDFSRECKKYRHGEQKKIIITLKDIDMNTRLKALNDKVITWDVNILNQILDLFAKPRIIV